MRQLTRIKGRVGLAKPSQNPGRIPARAAWETVSLKNAIRRAVTNTPSSEQRGARKSAARNARCMKGSVNMSPRSVIVVMMVGRYMNPVGLLKRVRIHHLVG